MTTVNADIDVDVPVSTAYNQWTQFESFPQFLSGVDEVTQVNDTDTHWKVSIVGVKREFDAEITEQIPDTRIAWTSTGGESHADWEPEGVVEHVGAALQIDDMQISRDLRKFKELIESNGFETGAWRGSIDRDGDATGR